MCIHIYKYIYISFCFVFLWGVQARRLLGRFGGIGQGTTVCEFEGWPDIMWAGNVMLMF